MSKKEVVPAPQTTTALAPIAVMAVDIPRLKESLTESLGGYGMSVFDLQRIKMPAGGGPAFTVSGLEGEEAIQKFQCAVIHARPGRAYWPNSVDETGGGQPPDCSSNDSITGHGEPGGTCAVCPLAQFGSHRDGRAQACKQVQNLFVFREGSDSQLPELFVLPPTSLGAWRKFAVTLAGRLLSPSSVLIEVGLQKAKSGGGVSYAQATFRAVRVLNPDEIARVKALAQVFRPLFGGPTVMPDDPAAAPPAAQEAPTASVETEPDDEDRPF